MIRAIHTNLMVESAFIVALNPCANFVTKNFGKGVVPNVKEDEFVILVPIDAINAGIEYALYAPKKMTMQKMLICVIIVTQRSKRAKKLKSQFQKLIKPYRMGIIPITKNNK
jgi:hypothetical protein